MYKYKPNLRKRIFATILDYGLYFLASYLYMMYFGYSNDQGGYTVEGLTSLPLFAGWFIYFVILESLFGATLAHLGFGLKVITLERTGITFIESLKRHLLDPIDIFVYGIPAIITIKNSEKHQRIGDMWAQTIVVDTDDPEQFPQRSRSI